MANVFGGLGVLNLGPAGRDVAESQSRPPESPVLDKDLAEAHAVAGLLAFWYEWDWEAAGRSFDRALSLNPGDAMSHGQRGLFYLNRRKFDEAIREIKKALELDPLMPLVLCLVGLSPLVRGKA